MRMAKAVIEQKISWEKNAVSIPADSWRGDGGSRFRSSAASSCRSPSEGSLMAGILVLVNTV